MDFYNQNISVFYFLNFTIKLASLPFISLLISVNIHLLLCYNIEWTIELKGKNRFIQIISPEFHNAV